MKQKQPETNVIRLTPEPKVDFWRTETEKGASTGVLAKVSIWHRLHKKKEAEKVEFTFFLEAKHLKRRSITHQLELRSVVGAADISERQIGQLRKQAKDVLDAFFKKYKREER